MTSNQARNLHEKLVNCGEFKNLKIEFTLENEAPETLLIVDDGYNIEVIYTDAAILVQENGADLDATTDTNWFTWATDPEWLPNTITQIKKLIASRN